MAQKTKTTGPLQQTETPPDIDEDSTSALVLIIALSIFVFLMLVSLIIILKRIRLGRRRQHQVTDRVGSFRRHTFPITRRMSEVADGKCDKSSRESMWKVFRESLFRSSTHLRRGVSFHCSSPELARNPFSMDGGGMVTFQKKSRLQPSQMEKTCDDSTQLDEIIVHSQSNLVSGARDVPRYHTMSPPFLVTGMVKEADQKTTREHSHHLPDVSEPQGYLGGELDQENGCQLIHNNDTNHGSSPEKEHPNSGKVRSNGGGLTEKSQQECQGRTSNKSQESASSAPCSLLKASATTQNVQDVVKRDTQRTSKSEDEVPHTKETEENRARHSRTNSFKRLLSKWKEYSGHGAN